MLNFFCVSIPILALLILVVIVQGWDFLKAQLTIVKNLFFGGK